MEAAVGFETLQPKTPVTLTSLQLVDLTLWLMLA
jgi:hypothetical protein